MAQWVTDLDQRLVAIDGKTCAAARVTNSRAFTCWPPTASTSRLLDQLLTQVARILALNGLEAVTREVVEAAREVLVIGTT